MALIRVKFKTCNAEGKDRYKDTPIASFMGPMQGPPGADRTQMAPCWPHVGPMNLVIWVDNVTILFRKPNVLFYMGYPSETHLNPNLAKSRLPITYFLIARSFWNFAQSTAAILSCPALNFKMIKQLIRMLRTKEFLRDLSLRCVWHKQN